MFLPENTVLLVMDVQERLVRLMPQKEELVRNITALIRVANFLDIPIMVTEQAPEKIGVTIPEIADLVRGRTFFSKKSFSGCARGEFMRALEALGRKEIMVVGIEAHVCVCQTVFDLMARHYQVQVAGDAVASRSQVNKDFALARMRAWGADVTSTEMAICELLRTSEHPKFKEIINLIK